MTNYQYLSRFEKGKRGYSQVDTYKACIDSRTENCSGITAHMQGLIDQLQKFPNEPTGWSFAQWKRKGCNNDIDNLVGSWAIVLEYALKRDDTEIVQRLYQKAQKLGWTFYMLDTENKKGNTISVVWPLTDAITDNARFARLASILACEMDEYDLASGCFSATHIVHVYYHTTPLVEHTFSGPLNPDKEIKRTAKLYQGLNARKFEGSRPKGQAISTAYDAPLPVEDDMFVWFETAEEKRLREAVEVMTRHGFQP